MATPTAMAAPHTRSIDDLKRTARVTALARRAGCDPGLGRALAGHVLASGLVRAGAVVAGYWPLPGEIDIRQLMTTLHLRGHTVALPVTPPGGQPLVFRRWQPAATLNPGRFGTWHPTGDAVSPDTLLVPLLAFDRDGMRLGYGGGYYDRTLAALPSPCTIGCAFAAQQVDAVPVGPFDVPLDAVATESGVHLVQDLSPCASSS